MIHKNEISNKKMRKIKKLKIQSLKKEKARNKLLLMIYLIKSRKLKKI